MGNILSNLKHYRAIADALREVEDCEGAMYTPAEMVDAIRDLVEVRDFPFIPEGENEIPPAEIYDREELVDDKYYTQMANELRKRFIGQKFKPAEIPAAIRFLIKEYYKRRIMMGTLEIPTSDFEIEILNFVKEGELVYLDWGDPEGQLEAIPVGERVILKHTYAYPGTYHIRVIGEGAQLYRSPQIITPTLTKLTIGNVVEIGEGAYTTCTGLSQIRISDYVQTIAERAFRDCSSLIRILGARNITKIGESAFENCVNLVYEVPTGLTEIGRRAFLHCYSCHDIVIPMGLQSIPEFCFSGDIRRLTFTHNLTRIADYAFQSTAPVFFIQTIPLEPIPCEGDYPFDKFSNQIIQCAKSFQESYKVALGWKTYLSVLVTEYQVTEFFDLKYNNLIYIQEYNRTKKELKTQSEFFDIKYNNNLLVQIIYMRRKKIRTVSEFFDIKYNNKIKIQLYQRLKRSLTTQSEFFDIKYNNKIKILLFNKKDIEQ